MMSYPLPALTRRAADYVAALRTIKARLEKGQAILARTPTVAAEVRWLTLACRSCRLIAKLADADGEAEASFLRSDLGRWYVALEWPEPSHAARLMDWCTPRRAA